MVDPFGAELQQVRVREAGVRLAEYEKLRVGSRRARALHLVWVAGAGRVMEIVVLGCIGRLGRR